MNQNKISIVTVVYNAEDHIEQTINSIINQTYQNIEYVIVDGGSTDKTLDIIKNYDKHISLWISEKDKGIYDAMNKALNLITGDYVWFMNAGDEIYSKNTVEEIFRDFSNEDVFYGKTQLIKQDGNVLKVTTTPQSLNWKSFQFGMVVSHQSIIFKSSLISKYDLSYKIVSDQDWIINNLKKSQNIKNTNQVLSKYLLDGFSGRNFHKAWREKFVIVKKHYGYFIYLLNIFSYFKAICKIFIKNTILKK